MWTRVKLVKQDACRDLFASFIVEDTMLCAGNTNDENKDVCTGDSGGPLVCLKDKTIVLSGIVSFGIGCGYPQLPVPNLYTRASEYLNWINIYTVSFILI